MAALARRIAALGGIGDLRPAPGTWASAAVLPLAFLPGWVALLAAALFTAAGFWALARLPEVGEDPPWVVVDEAAGQSLALAFAGGLAGALLAFALFRFFDTVKPGAVGWADRQPGALGIMLDDLLAGAMAAIPLVVLGLFGWQ